MTKAYSICTYRSISDPVAQAAYTKLAAPVFVAAGGRFLARGVPSKTIEQGLMQRTVLIEFDSVEEAVAAYSSPGYQEALTALGARAAERDIRIIEGSSDEAKTESVLGNKRPTDLPQGYRQGLITAIGAVLGFTLLLIRYWNFEAPGGWTPASATAGLLMAVATMLEIFALYRSLQLTDNNEIEYGKTVRWFVLSAGVLLGSILLATLAFSNVIPFSHEDDWQRICKIFR